jgi:hypothetical protein
MATDTAYMLVGTAHQNDGGMIPTHELTLSENSRPSWSLYKRRGPKPISVWTPTVEDMLEDGLLMAGLLAIGDKSLTDAAKVVSPKCELYDDILPESRKRLHELCREIPPTNKVTLTVLRGSTILRQLPVLEKYQIDVEVCVSK